MKTAIASVVAAIVAVVLYRSIQPAPEPVKQPEIVPAYELMAKDKMQDLLKSNYWSHENSNMCDYTCRYHRANAEGYVAENLYVGQTCDIRNAVKLWNESPTHKKILDTPYDEGVIIIKRNEFGCYIVMEVSR